MKLRGVLYLFLAGFAGAAAAQNPVHAPALGPPPAAQSGPMELDVVVTDKAGHPVPGLQQSDFTLLDDKQPATIKSFHAFDSTDPSTNPTQVILLVDEVNTTFSAISTERDQLQNFLLQNQGHLQFPVSMIFLTDTGMQTLNKPTTDGNALNDQLKQKQSQLRAITRSSGFYGAAERMQLSLQGLQTVATAAANVPGRKLLVWISPGWPIMNNPDVYVSEKQQKSFFGVIVELSNSLRQSHVTLYSVDPLGAAAAAQIRNAEWRDFVKPVRNANHAEPADLALQAIATQSGGEVLFGSNDVASEISKFVEDGTAWYALTFDPQRADAPNTWHDLEVKLDKAGLKVRTRNGYYAGP
jgi:VWFA-related protein